MNELYVSVDIETDGPIPGPHSMLSLGAVALNGNGDEVSTFAINFVPLAGATPDPDTQTWWEKQPAEIYRAARENPQPPLPAMRRFRDWIEELTGPEGRAPGASPVFVGYPAGFDFTFVYWYLIKFTGGSPFSFSAVDIKTFAMAALGKNYRSINKRELKHFIPKDLKHTHIALDDAREQGQLFFNLIRHNNRRGSQ